jgi:hypothetical protein
MKCKFYDTCNAPLCLNDPESLLHGIFFPGESICKLSNVPEWVKRQRKLARVADKDTAFTVEMLKHRFIIRKGIKGIDPDRPSKYLADDVKNWIASHPAITDSEREARRKQALKNLAKRAVS